jgi:glucose-1-phosphate thymidylyltransferase
MLPIANKPMLMYGFDQLRASGIKEIGIILGPLQEGIVQALGDGSKFGVKITYIEQPDPKGIAHAVLISRRFLGDSPFIVHLGDNLLKDDIPELAREFLRSEADATVILTRVKDPERFGVVELKNGKIVRLVEKPEHYVSDLALAGVYFFRSSIFPVIEKLRPSWRNELEITDAIQSLLDIGGKITYHEVAGWWKDTGRPEDILEANRLVLRDLKSSVRGMIEEDAAVSGSVDIGRGTIVRKGAVLKGPVAIGDDSEIGEGATVGPNTSIGSRVRILRAEVENSIVLDGTVVDCKESIVDSIIGKDSRIVSGNVPQSRGRSFVVGERTFVRL